MRCPSRKKNTAVVERPRAVVCWMLAARIVQKHEIEIRNIAEFQAAELAVAGHGHAHRAQRRFLIAAVRNAVNCGHLLPRQIHAALQ